MAMFVHIAPAKLKAAILRSGVRPGRSLMGGAWKNECIFAFPVLQSHTLTHQWTREVLKWRREPLIGVYFRVDDDECVLFGHYNRGLARVRAAEAVGAVRAAPDPRGFEVRFERKITPAEIHRIAPVRGVIGWRHMPDAHSLRPCGCPACVARGEPGGRKLRQRYEAGGL